MSDKPDETLVFDIPTSENSRSVPKEVTQWTGDQFEYWCETVKKLQMVAANYTERQMQDDFNKRGAEGWELVTIQVAPVNGMVLIQHIWKRKKQRTIQ